MKLAGRPGPVEVPSAVSAIAAGDDIDAVWLNQLGGLTFAIGPPEQPRHFVKWQPKDCAIDLAAEIVRLEWVAPFTPVPRVDGYGEDDDGRWLVTVAMPGTTAVADRWKDDPRPAVDAIGTGLRFFHDQVPIAGCPYDWSVESRLANADHPLDPLADPPTIDRMVVCHGDACAPNTLIDDDGVFAGHVDLGALGVADRWADLAVASWSLEWNFGPGWDDRFFAAYGIDPDRARLAYYRLLWEC